MTRKLFFIGLFLILFIFAGCQSSHQVEVKPVEIKPIHITIDVNIRVEKALDDFFDDLEVAEDKIKE
ncbi:MAG: YnbE family lipoprotein [Desulfobacula sp.]|nr:YnbE family lipoprotein [Desulfobacula sp.]